MRPERISLKQAQRVYDGIAAAMPQKNLPPIDMADIFDGRRSIKVTTLLAAINVSLDALWPQS